MSRVTKTVMPKCRLSGGNQGVSDRQMEWVQRSGDIAPGDQSPRQYILHRTAIRVKLNKTIIINGKLTNINVILNELW